jgi:hypothetical protein
MVAELTLYRRQHRRTNDTVRWGTCFICFLELLSFLHRWKQLQNAIKGVGFRQGGYILQKSAMAHLSSCEKLVSTDSRAKNRTP